MKKTSNENMEDVFQLLATIKVVEPNPNLYALTLRRIQNKQVVSFFWVRLAACLLAVFLASEGYVMLDTPTKKEKDISLIMTTTNNILYHE